MNLPDALRASQKTRRHITRGGAWAVYSEAWVYHFTIEDLLADDWKLMGPPMSQREWEENLKVEREDDD